MGIDLGTTNSAVAVVVDGKPVIIRCAARAARPARVHGVPRSTACVPSGS